MKNVLAVIVVTAIIIAFLGLLGTVGALEQDAITIGAAVKRSVIFLLILVANGLGLWRLEREDDAPVYDIR